MRASGVALSRSMLQRLINKARQTALSLARRRHVCDTARHARRACKASSCSAIGDSADRGLELGPEVESGGEGDSSRRMCSANSGGNRARISEIIG